MFGNIFKELPRPATLRLVNRAGEHQASRADILWARPCPRLDQYSPERLGFTAQTLVTTLGRHTGGACHLSMEQLMDQYDLVQLLDERVAINPHIPLTLGVIDPSITSTNVKEKTFYLKHTGGTNPILTSIERTSPELLLQLFPNIKPEAPGKPRCADHLQSKGKIPRL